MERGRAPVAAKHALDDRLGLPRAARCEKGGRKLDIGVPIGARGSVAASEFERTGRIAALGEVADGVAVGGFGKLCEATLPERAGAARPSVGLGGVAPRPGKA